MKKKILATIGVIVLLIAGVFAYSVISDLMQEKKLIEERNEISEMVNAENIEIDKIYEKLNQTVTKGDYAEVEKAFKSLLKDNFDNTIKLTEVFEDETLTNILTVENYKEDGKDFVETKRYIATTKEELQNCKSTYLEFFTEEKAMSYINNKGLDSYYIDLYKDEFVKDIESEKTDTTVEDSVDDIIAILDVYEEVIDFLVENQASWEIDGENIVFANDELSEQYNQLLNKLP